MNIRRALRIALLYGLPVATAVGTWQAIDLGDGILHHDIPGSVSTTGAPDERPRSELELLLDSLQAPAELSRQKEYVREIAEQKLRQDSVLEAMRPQLEERYARVGIKTQEDIGRWILRNTNSLQKEFDTANGVRLGNINYELAKADSTQPAIAGNKFGITGNPEDYRTIIIYYEKLPFLLKDLPRVDHVSVRGIIFHEYSHVLGGIIARRMFEEGTLNGDYARLVDSESVDGMFTLKRAHFILEGIAESTRISMGEGEAVVLNHWPALYALVSASELSRDKTGMYYLGPIIVRPILEKCGLEETLRRVFSNPAITDAELVHPSLYQQRIMK